MGCLFNKGKVKIEMDSLGICRTIVEDTNVGFIQSLSLDLNVEGGIQNLTIMFPDPAKIDDVKIKQSIQKNIDLVNSAGWVVVKTV